MKIQLGVLFAVLALAGCGRGSPQAPTSSAATVGFAASGATTPQSPSTALSVPARLSSTSAGQVLVSDANNQLLHCSDVQYGNPNYSYNMDRLAKLARLPDRSYSRYDEDVVGYLCRGDTKSIQDEVDAGFVKQSEVDGIKEALGLDKRSDTGMSYGYSRQKFSDMGLCEACADNVAQYYTKKPDSKCGRLAKQALEGNPRAVEALQSSPDYCTWHY